MSLKKCPDLLLQLFATDQIDFACVDFIRSTARFMEP